MGEGHRGLRIGFILITSILALALILSASWLRPSSAPVSATSFRHRQNNENENDENGNRTNVRDVDYIVQTYNRSGIDSDEALLFSNMQNTHARFFRNLRKEGARVSSLGNRAVPLLKPLSFHQQEVQEKLHYTRQDLRRIDSKLRNYAYQLQKRQERLQMVEDRKAELKKDLIAELGATAAERWTTLENDKEIRVEDLQRRISELEQLKASVRNSYSKKQMLWESTIPEQDYAELNRRQARIVEEIEGARAESASLAREIQLYNDAKAYYVNQLEFAAKTARENAIALQQ